MDGNGRWARQRGHNRFFGHVRGAKAAKKIIEECARQKIQYLSLFAFSTENWRRPRDEVQFLMNLLVRRLWREQKNLVQNNIRFESVGELSGLPQEVQNAVEDTVQKTRNNTGLTLIFALNYGGRDDITRSVKNIAQKVKQGELSPGDITDDVIHDNLRTSSYPNPDLIIRTSGETRLSNFYLWQAAYSEFYFCEKLWPDFKEDDLYYALEFFQSRQRRFGKTGQQLVGNTETVSKDSLSTNFNL